MALVMCDALAEALLGLHDVLAAHAVHAVVEPEVGVLRRTCNPLQQNVVNELRNTCIVHLHREHRLVSSEQNSLLLLTGTAPARTSV